jgi:hypothetical protein
MARKIGIVLALDGEPTFTAGMRKAQSSVKLAQQELKNLDRECKGNANTLETLTQRGKALSKVEEEQEKVLEKANAGRKNALDVYKKANATLDSHKSKLADLEKAIKSNDRSSEEARKEAKQYREAIKAQEIEIVKADAAITDWDTKISKAKSDLSRTSREIKLNSQYVAEAKASTDGCAKSIDNFGKSMQATGNDAEESAKKTSLFTESVSNVKKGIQEGIGINLASKLGGMLEDAAKKFIEAGKAAAAYADEVLTSAQVTGMSTDRIQELTYAAGLIDTEFSIIEGAMRKSLSSMRSAAKGSGEAAASYEKLGVSVKKADGSLRNSEDVFWDCIDALGRIEDETERDSVAMQIFGKSAQELNPLIAKGSSGFKELAKEAHDAGYVLSSETLDKLGSVQDSFDRLDAAGKNFGNAVGAVIAPALGGLADVATNVLNGIARLFQDNRSEALKLAEVLEESTEKARESLEWMKGWGGESAQEIGKLEAYRDVLLTVADAEVANAYQKHQVSQIVEELGGQIPELTEAWDEQAGTLNLTRTEINKLINAQEEYAKQQVFIEARTEAYDALYTAELNAAKAQGQLNDLFGKASGLIKSKVHGVQGEIIGTIRSVEDLDAAYNALVDGGDNELLDALAAMRFEAAKLQDAVDDTTPVIENCNEELDKLDSAAKVMGIDLEGAGNKAEEGMKKAEVAVSEAAVAAGAALHGFQESAEEMYDVVAEAFDDAHDAAENAFSVSAFEAWEKDAEKGIGKMAESLAKQTAALEEYSRNFALVSDDLRERSPEFLAYVQDLGKDGAQLVADLADAFRNGDTKAVDDLIGRYEKALDAQDEIADISAKNTVAIKKAQGEFASTQKEWDGLDEAVRKVQASGLPEALSDELREAVKVAKEEGIKIPQGLADEISSSDDPVNAATTCIGKLYSAIDGQKTALYNVAKDTAHQVGAGFIIGLQEKYGDVIDASTGMINVALEKARARARIESPSKLFRDEVGKFLPAGVAAGIREGNSLTVQAAEESMNDTLAAMKKWLTKNKAGVEEIAYTWQSVATAALKNSFGISRTKTEGSGKDIKTVQKTRNEYAGEVLQAASAYLSNLKQLYDVTTRQEIDFWRGVRARLSSGTQAWITASGKIRTLQKQAATEAKKQRQEEKNAAKEQKAAEEQHYADRLSAMESYVSHRKAMETMSTAQERNYWEKYLAEFKKGSDEYKKVQEKLVALESRVISERLEKYEAYISRQSALQKLSITKEKEYWEKRIAEFKKGSDEYKGIQERLALLESSIGTSEVAASALSAYQVYYSMSEKAEVQYWNTIRKTYKAGTEDRLEADRQYLAAKTKLQDKISEIESDYADRIEAATARYKDAVAARRDAIYGAFGLFDEFESKSATGSELLFNIQSQAAGYEEWAKSLKELEGRGIFSESLLKELSDKGPGDIAAIKALLSLTDDQMQLYQNAYDRKDELSDKWAKEENADLKKEVKAEIEALEITMKVAIGEVSEPITDELKAVATKIGEVAADQTAALVAAFREGGAAASGSTGASVSASVKSAAGVTDEQTNGKTKEENEKEWADAVREARSITQKVEEGERKENEKELALKAIRSAKKLPAPLTQEERKRHAAIYNYIADRYGVSGSSSLYKKLASIFGLPEYGGTGAERMKILEQLKAHGLRSGTRNSSGGAVWMDEELDTKGPEIIVRKSDRAILTRLEAADAVIPANLANNLFAWGAIDPKSIGVTTMAPFNERLAQAFEGQTKVMMTGTETTRDILGLLADYLPHLADKKSVCLDSGKIVGELAGEMSRELARRGRRTLR